jgi:hypothetical protein
LAKILNGSGAAAGHGAGLKGIRSGYEANHGRAEKVEDVGAESGVEHLHGIDVAELTGTDTLCDELQRAAPHGLEGFFRDDAHGVGLAGAEADHLLLHERMKSVVGEVAVEMLEDQAEDALAGAAVQIEKRERVPRDFPGHFFECRYVKSFLVAEIVIEQGLVDAGRSGDGAGARACQSVLAEFPNGCMQNAVAGLVGAAVLRSRH